MRMTVRQIIFVLAVLCLAARAEAQDGSPSNSEANEHAPALLSFEELVALSGSPKPDGVLGERLDALLSTPFVNTEAAVIPPHRPIVENLGPVLRMGLWNIERGLNFDQIRFALSDPAKFRSMEMTASLANAARAQLADAQLRTLQDVDVLILNEADWGMKRTGYRDVTRELAAALHMNYAYGVEFLELDPIFDLDTEQVHLPDPQEDARLQEDLRVDHERFLGLHGTAILSRYPLRNVRIFRLPVCYDWYGEEVKETAKLEKGKRWVANRLFRERIDREVRQGGRMALVADVAIPDLPSGEATIVAAHLENRCEPACRRKQMNALLAQLQQVKNPVVIAGDLNTTSKTNTPTSLRNEIMSRVTDYQFWIRQAVSYFNPLGIFKHLLFPIHYFHGYNDPTAFHLPIFWDNRERALFKTVEKFRFADGHAFDFRGESQFTLNQRTRTLANSNQRAGKGFVPTYSFARDYGGLVGRFKLDWFFVKPFIEDPRRAGQTHRFAPTFAQTMRELNESVADRISDHPPMTVDLPLLDQQH
jgi:endonuclease/exonuclease/phosphatase family metal-dependent hydrolase